MTGYELEATEKKSSTSKPTIELESDDFAIVFRGAKVEAIVPTGHLEKDNLTPDEELAHAQIDGTISYLMHCLMRDDWQEEFFDAVDEYLDNASEIEAIERRSQFKLIVSESAEDDE